MKFLSRAVAVMLSLALLIGEAQAAGGGAILLTEVKLTGYLDATASVSPQLTRIPLSKKRLLTLAGYDEVDPATTKFFISGNRETVSLYSSDTSVFYTDVFHLTDAVRATATTQGNLQVDTFRNASMLDGRFTGTALVQARVKSKGNPEHRAMVKVNLQGGGSFTGASSPDVVLAFSISYLSPP